MITCDNASSNDKMIEKLASRLVEFPRAPNCACCFTHILNLVVKSIMSQFDVPRSDPDVTDEGACEIQKLAGDIEREELEMQDDQDNPQEPEDGGPSHDNDEGWIDEWEDMTGEDVGDLEESVWPIRFLLTKVSCENKQELYSISQLVDASDLQTCICSQELKHHHPFSVVLHLREPLS